MFIQIIEGKASDPKGLREQFDRWTAELMPGATGFFGSTGGVSDDGTFITMARFESESAARANSDRPEQGQWWSETEKYLENVSFRDTSDVELRMGGGSDEARFVQVMQGRVTDRARLGELDDRFEEEASGLRPDVLGSIRAWTGDEFTEAIYFTSESEAREGERREMPEGLQEVFGEWQALMKDLRYIDLRDPWLRSA